MKDFERLDFYITPPAKNATPEEWAEWIIADDRKAAAHKAQRTKSLEQCDTPAEYMSDSTVKSGGVHRQTLAIGFTGSEDALAGEVRVGENQSGDMVWADMERRRNRRGGSKAGKSARRRANRKRRVK